MVYIYGLIDPRQPDIIRYIGKTKMLLIKRLQSHIDESKKAINQTHKINWIKLLLSQNIRPEIILIETCSKSIWQDKEKFYIEKYRKLFNLTNTSDGGFGGSIGVTKSVIQYSIDGVFIKIYNSIDEACIDNNLDRGVINSALQRNKNGGYGGNYLWSYYTKGYPKYIPPYIEIKCITRIKDLVTNEVKIFLSLKEGLDYFKINRSGCINKCIKNKIPYKKRYSIIFLN